MRTLKRLILEQFFKSLHVFRNGSNNLDRLASNRMRQADTMRVQEDTTFVCTAVTIAAIAQNRMTMIFLVNLLKEKLIKF